MTSQLTLQERIVKALEGRRRPLRCETCGRVAPRPTLGIRVVCSRCF